MVLRYIHLFRVRVRVRVGVRVGVRVRVYAFRVGVRVGFRVIKLQRALHQLRLVLVLVLGLGLRLRLHGYGYGRVAGERYPTTALPSSSPMTCSAWFWLISVALSPLWSRR